VKNIEHAWATDVAPPGTRFKNEQESQPKRKRTNTHRKKEGKKEESEKKNPNKLQRKRMKFQPRDSGTLQARTINFSF
jgi:hypothetical protein